MPYKDIREFLQFLEQKGELARIGVEVDLNYELGAVCRKALDVGGEENNKALLFARPKGYEIPVVANILSSRRRYAMALEVAEKSVQEEYLKRVSQPIPPRIVKDGPCKENVRIGKEVDLFEFPIPIWNEEDAGPYITFPCHISKDPETGWRNVGTYRGMVHDKNHIGVQIGPYRHLAMQCQKAHARNRPFPLAIAIGVDPSIYVASVAPIAQGVDELGVAGGLRGEPVEMVKCETIDAEVPAAAEIVLEAEMIPGDMREEGPFGEFTGYYGERSVRPVITLRAITFRNKPVMVGSYEGRPPQETSVTEIIPQEAEIMRCVTLPGLVKIHIPTGGAQFVAIASIKKLYEGYSKLIAMQILSTIPGRWIKTLILVDEDIEPFNRGQVDWALATRFQPKLDVTILDDMPGIALDPSIRNKSSVGETFLTSKVILDATKSLDPNYPREVRPPEEIMKKVESRWMEYGVT
jgi:2,5-furandicarboxylate decarboxylase 1